MDRVPRPIVLDVDTGTDDALAILYAVRHPDLDVRAISCVAGNSGLDQVVINTARGARRRGSAGHPRLPPASPAADERDSARRRLSWH